MPKFDYVIMNPPYKNQLYIDFINFALDIAERDQGQLVYVAPGVYLNHFTNTPNLGKLYLPLKQRLQNHLSKVIFRNFNKQFNIALAGPSAICNVDYSKEYTYTDVDKLGIYTKEDNVNNCNIIGDFKLIQSILDKVLNYNIGDIRDKLTDKKEGPCYMALKLVTAAGSKHCQYTDMDELRNYCTTYKIPHYMEQCNGYKSLNHLNNSTYAKDINVESYNQLVFGPISMSNKVISDKIHKIFNGSYFTDKDALCICGERKELENLQYNYIHSKLTKFVNICVLLNARTTQTSLKFTKWLVDKKYNDEELYKLFGITEEEIKLIEHVVDLFNLENKNNQTFQEYLYGIR